MNVAREAWPHPGYTPAPRKARKDGPVAASAVPLALLVASAASLLLGRAAAPKAPAAAPAPLPGLSLPMPSSVSARHDAAAPAAAPAAEETAEPAAPTFEEDAPAWAAAALRQAWSWPIQLAFGGASGFARAERGRTTRRLVAWDPSAAPDRQAVYAVLDANGREIRQETDADVAAAARASDLFGRPDPSTLKLREGVGSGLLASARNSELKALAAAKGAVSVQGMLAENGMPVAKLTYADGREELAYYDPLVFDLKGRGVQTAGRKVLFDLFGYGRTDKLQSMDDIADATGILVFDAGGSGRAGRDGRGVFGDRTSLYGGEADGFADGFAALQGLVERAESEGVLARGTAASGELDAAALSALEKAYGLRMRVGGLQGRDLTLAKAGVAAIALPRGEARRIADFDGHGNSLLVRPGAAFRRADGSVGSYMNIWLKAGLGGLGLRRVAMR